MENTLENKAKFFAQYWDQRLVDWKGNKIGLQRVCLGRMENSDYWLELKSLSSVTDEDAREYLHSIGCHSLGERIQQAKRQLQEDHDADLYSSDYLRSKGYALPWMGLTVKEMITFGWIKLKSD